MDPKQMIIENRDWIIMAGLGVGIIIIASLKFDYIQMSMIKGNWGFAFMGVIGLAIYTFMTVFWGKTSTKKKITEQTPPASNPEIQKKKIPRKNDIFKLFEKE